MDDPVPGLDITESLQVLDWLKAELVAAAGAVLRAGVAREPARLLETLAALQITVYPWPAAGASHWSAWTPRRPAAWPRRR